MQEIYKSFGANDVLKNVDFEVCGGEICALLGENGAGKSTLMNILGGVISADSGNILIDGNKVTFHTPSESMNSGIAFIHQELSLINDLAIFENMFIGREKKKRSGLVDSSYMIKKTREIFDELDIKLDPKTMVRDLDASYKQIVEIARAMMMDASIIIMDEPTTALTDPEIERVFEMMRMLKSRGVGIILISHKLREIMAVCDKYTVLRDGAAVSNGLISDVTTHDLARFMVGHEVHTENLNRNKNIGKEMLRGENLSDGKNFEEISFSVASGEILGITGLLGDGRSELFRSVFGASHYDGKIFFEQKPVKISSIQKAIELGIGYVPRNRKEDGIIKDMSIIENSSVVIWPEISKLGIIDRKKQNKTFDEKSHELHIKYEKQNNLITSLSGGNQQKVVLSKWLSANPKVLILDNPTQGVDVGAKEEIYNIILQLAENGIAIIVLSSEAQEIIRLCDRAIVMYHGKIQGELLQSDMTEQTIMHMATGANDTENAKAQQNITAEVIGDET